MLTKVQKWGNSQGLRVTKALLDEAGIHVGDEVDISVRKGRIIVEPLSRIRGRYDLRALVMKMPEEYQPEEIDWGRRPERSPGRWLPTTVSSNRDKTV